MVWIKRNLFFVVGAVVAVVLMAAIGVYDFRNWQRNSAAMETLNETYSTLQQLNNQNPSWGSEKVNNIKTAGEQRDQLQAWISGTGNFFEPIPAIPDNNNGQITGKDFADALSRTIAQLQHDATVAGVTLPPQYSFSFTVQQQGLRFAPGSLEPLSARLGEVAKICEILFAAKINSLDGLRRVRVSDDDAVGPQSDYINESPVTNNLAIFTPYEITFRCFSQDLAEVLTGFASSSYGFIVNGINVQPAGASIESPAGSPPYGRDFPPQQNMPGNVPYGRAYGYSPQQNMSPPPGNAPYGSSPSASPSHGGSQTVLDEQLLSITLRFDTVKLLPQK